MAETSTIFYFVFFALRMVNFYSVLYNMKNNSGKQTLYENYYEFPI